jgi:hypothetical protein
MIILKINIVLVEPEIPQNTGNIARSCAATGAKLHLVHPLGFSITEKQVKRAGLDYWDKVDIEEHASLEAFLEKYPQEYETQTLLDNHRYQPLLQVFLSPRNEALKRWEEGPYEQNPYKPEGKIHCIHPGLSVRSKAEAMIASRLQTHRIPFRYECILYIAGRPVYPDFTIRHPDTGEPYYWEHLGLLEDPAYSRRAGEKITLYANGGIYINRNLILTDETRQNPLSVSEIDKVISDYFLCA